MRYTTGGRRRERPGIVAENPGRFLAGYVDDCLLQRVVKPAHGAVVIAFDTEAVAIGGMVTIRV